MFKYYVIHNLEKYRRERITTQLQQHGVDMRDVKFINYPNKKDLTFDKKKNFVQKGIKIKDGWIAVTYKHYLALKDIVENSYPYGIIIEDNVGRFKENIPIRLNRYLKELDEGWDIIYDSDWISYQNMNEEEVKPEKIVYKKSNDITYGKTGEIIAHGGTKSAQFYMVNLDSAKKYHYNYSTSLFFLSLIAFPVILFISYYNSGIYIVYISKYVYFIYLFIYLILKFILLNRLNLFQISFIFYNILYLCALELIPYLGLFELLQLVY